MMSKKKKAKIEEVQDTPVDVPKSPENEEIIEQDAVESEKNATVGESQDAPEEKNGEDQLKDRLLRLQADFDNFRKRTARERTEWQAYATEQLILELLPVVDHYELGLATAEKHGADKAVVDGLKLVYDQLLGVFKKQGVVPLTAEPGTPFNPHEHEAISHIPSEDHPADVIIAETRRGYKQGEKLIRPLQVVVSSGSVNTNEIKSAE